MTWEEGEEADEARAGAVSELGKAISNLLADEGKSSLVSLLAVLMVSHELSKLIHSQGPPQHVLGGVAMLMRGISRTLEQGTDLRADVFGEVVKMREEKPDAN
jgi:hypothetical protein